MKSVLSVLSFGCVHIPYSDEGATNHLADAIRGIRPDHVVCLGDLLDCYDLSSFDCSPDKGVGFSEEVERSVEFLSDLKKKSPKSQFHYTPGNHERRLRKYLIRKAPALSPLRGLQIENILELNSLGWEYHAIKAEFIKGWIFSHGDSYVSKDGGNTVRRHLLATGKSNVIAHSHRQAVVRHTDAGRTINGIESGCLCKLNLGEKVWEVPFARMQDWQQGFSVIQINCHSGKLIKAELYATQK